MRDLAIIGGGLVGLSAALVLQHPARRVSLIEAGDLKQPQSGGLNTRSIALSASSVQVFRAIGVWPQIADAATPIKHIHISARGRWGVTRLEAEDHELDALGYVVENSSLSECLRAAAHAADGIELFDRAEFETIGQDTAVHVGYRRDGKAGEVDARLALIADGARSRARAALDIGHHSIDYGQSVLVCNVEVDRPRAGTAYERFTPQGPLALLPLGGRRYACVWTLNPRQGEVVSEFDEAQFCAALQRAFGYRLGLIERAGERFVMPLERVRADALQRGRAILIGNAANALHPVAGQGFNLALRDVACLYELLVERDLAGLDDDGVERIARAFEDQRVAEQRRVIRYGDGLVKLFSNDLPLLNQARAAALGLLDLAPALKAQVALAGMGLTYGGNRLLRGHL